jgi:DNA-binding response OmpR family regulator
MVKIKKKQVLVVDDEPMIAKVLRIKLSFSGYDVISTTSGIDAIELVRTQKPDIMLLDILMPDITGIDVLEQVRTFSQVPIIIFTGRPEMGQSALQLGANDCITKPFDPNTIVEKIEFVLTASKTGKKLHEF